MKNYVSIHAKFLNTAAVRVTKAFAARVEANKEDRTSNCVHKGERRAINEVNRFECAEHAFEEQTAH